MSEDLNTSKNTDISANLIRNIDKISNPYALVIAALLLFSPIITMLIGKATGLNFTIVISFSCICLFVLCICICRLAFSSPKMDDKKAADIVAEKNEITSSEKENEKYDVFFACPMSAFPKDEEYQKCKKECQTIINEIKQHANITNVFCPADLFEEKNQFQEPAVSLEIDTKAIKQSKYFIMYYPKKIVSSVLFEAGYAYATGKKCIYFVKKIQDLPYLMQTSGAPIPNMKAYIIKDTNDILKKIRNNKGKIFD